MSFEGFGTFRPTDSGSAPFHSTTLATNSHISLDGSPKAYDQQHKQQQQEHEQAIQKGVWRDFARHLEKSHADIFQAVEGFYGVVHNQALNSTPNSEQEQDALLEAHFWLLFRDLYSYRTQTQKQTETATGFKLGSTARSSPSSSTSVTEKQAHETRIVLKWLQQSLLSPNIPAQTSATKWMHTKLQLQGVGAGTGETQNQNQGAFPMSTLVASLDVDAPIRECIQSKTLGSANGESTTGAAKTITKQDADQDAIVFKTAFELLRKGEMRQAIDWSRNTGNFSLALAIQGYEMMNKPNSSPSSSIQLQKQLWRECCQRLVQSTNGSESSSSQPAPRTLAQRDNIMAKPAFSFGANPNNATNVFGDKGFGSSNIGNGLTSSVAQEQLSVDSYPGQFEKAVYGFLIGDLDSILPLCDTWTTQFIAYLTHMCAQLDDALTSVSSFSSLQIPTVGRIMDLLANSPNMAISEESKNSCRVMDGAIINDSIVDIVSNSAENLRLVKAGRLENCLEIASPYVLRMLGNCIACLSSLGHDTGPGTEDVMETFFQALVSQGLTNHTPIYISMLQQQRSPLTEGQTSPVVQLHANIVSDIVEANQRSQHINLCRQFNVDIVASIRCAFTQRMLQTQTDYPSVSTGSMDGEISSLDEDLYLAAQWFESAEIWPDAAYAFTAIYTRYLLAGKINSFYEFATMTSPNRIVNQVDQVDLSRPSGDKLRQPLEIAQPGETSVLSNPMHQRTLLIAYNKLLVCMSAFNTWKQLYSDYSDTSKWREVAMQQVTTTHNLVTNFCKDWLKDTATVEGQTQSDQKPSQKQLTDLIVQLQTIYLPYVIIEFAQVLLDAAAELGEQYTKQICKLANMVAEPDSQLSMLFVRSGSLPLFLDKIAEASVELLEKGSFE